MSGAVKPKKLTPETGVTPLETGIPATPDLSSKKTPETSPKPLVKEKLPPPVLTHLENRQVIIMVGNRYLKIGSLTRPVLGRSGPCMALKPSKTDDDGLAPPMKLPDLNTFTAFTFLAAETALLKARKDGNVDVGMRVRLSLQQEGVGKLLCARHDAQEGCIVIFDPIKFGCDWKLTAVGLNTFVMESLQFKDTCLAVRKDTVYLRKLTDRDRVNIRQGVWHKDSTCTIRNKPDFAVREVGLIVN